MKKTILIITTLLCGLVAKADLNSLAPYVWNVADAPKTFGEKLQLSFVRPSHGFPNWGTVLAGGGYSSSQDGGIFQLYIPYSASLGGDAPQIRLGLHNNQGWSGWETLYTSANANNSSSDWNAKDFYADGNVGIGTTNTGSHKLVVNGSIRAKEIIVETG